jgi:hypothetical protein
MQEKKLMVKTEKLFQVVFFKSSSTIFDLKIKCNRR